jgi:hypothetical protein
MQLIQPNGDLLFNRVGPLYFDGYPALDSALLDLLGVRYVLTTVDIPNANYALVYDDEIRVYENLDALPRAFIVPQQINMPGEALPTGWSEAFNLALRSLNPREAVILDGDSNGLGIDLPPEAAQPLPPGAAPAVAITRYTPNEIVLTVTRRRPGWLVLADAYFPGWRAFARPQSTPDADETELTIHRANGTFRAVQMQPGTWEVRFKYAPRSVQVGLYVSFLSGMLLLFILGYWAWGKLYRETDSDSAIKPVAKNSLVPMVMALSNR